MSAASDTGGRQTARSLWLRAALIWLLLNLLLGATIVGAYLPLGDLKLPVALLIAALKAGLVIWIFMEMASASALSRFALLTGLLMAALLFALTYADEATRTHTDDTFPGSAPVQPAD
ncbi:hypothetical protein OCGS_1439 [Oceaniovalibus guishaninsula JLT2003]|uniref:Caa(3)-type oxidase, subunit IV n=1 Tax=Oceaniovalibus guishaninsula JLT2003 TaxID=1231392 RepID=K2GPL8_9RHOB|nr:cytochrome C oxidase subunit IV family protein [Oceaniovalibus guishaninsula]EKE44601.1 hypothetical protein OCGS_1439 [Oceaniovalibus guishaninsula JLT2003]